VTVEALDAFRLAVVRWARRERVDGPYDEHLGQPERQLELGALLDLDG
jgi:hypothetical protein